ncbi:MAG TPA: ATP-binding cassette domain-containing protein [Micromonosporaceae bacterium]
MADVVLEQVSKIFPDGTVALENVDLTVLDGEFVVLVGPSGCGKSTLLRIVAGLDTATTGSVSIGGRVVDDLSAKDRDIAMVFQNYALYSHMTVAENLGFSLKLRHVPKETARSEVDNVAHMLALESLVDRKPRALSGGQRQRVAMGRAMVRHPKVFLMDEPLSNLDAKLRVAMRGELIRLHREWGTTTLYVTHDQIEAMTLGHRIAVLNAGRLQQVGTPKELYQTPCNLFVAGFIGSPAMNLVSGRLDAGADGALMLSVGGQRWPVPDSQLRRRPTLAAFVGREVVAGLRPYAISVDTGSSGDGACITVTAAVVEDLGSEKNVLFVPPFEVPDAVGGGTDTELIGMWTANVKANAEVRTGGKVTLRLDMDRAYFFDPGNGLAIPIADDASVVAAA